MCLLHGVFFLVIATQLPKQRQETKTINDGSIIRSTVVKGVKVVLLLIRMMFKKVKRLSVLHFLSLQNVPAFCYPKKTKNTAVVGGIGVSYITIPVHTNFHDYRETSKFCYPSRADTLSSSSDSNPSDIQRRKCTGRKI